MDDLIKTFLTSSVPLLSLGNPHFMGLMNLIEGFTPPTITQFTGILKSHVQMAINLAVTEIILSDLHYSISVDVSNESYSTKKFMGIALHYYSEVSNEVKTIAIDLKKCHLTGSLQVCDVVKHLLADLKLPPNRLVRIVAGSGRMKKAVFRHVDPEDDENDVESSDDEDEEMDGSNTDQVMESINNVLGNSRNSAQMEPVEDGCVNVALLGDLDLDRYIQLLEKSEGAGNKDPGFIGDHFTCAVYRLQQVCEAVFDRCEAMVVMRDNVQKLLTAFARSPEAMSRLRSENGASLNFPANNQWATMEKVFSRIIDIREALHTVCTEQFRVSYINSDDVRLMEIAVAFLRPFNQYMTVLQRSSVPTLPLLFTGLSHLIVTLEGTPSKLDLPPRGIAFDVNSLMTALCTEIKTQFADVLSPGPDSDPIFIAASALDATVASFLLAHVNLTAVREAVIKCIKIFQLGSPESTPEVEVKPAVVNPFGFGPSIQVNKPPAMENTAEKEVEYLIYLIQNKQWNCANPFDLFDTYNLTTLKQLAFVLASVPATSAAVDRLFTKMSDIDIDLSNKTEASIFKIRCIGGFNMQV
uniref:Dimer_Tnp_hAT domain-containing protein n=1 Tax=Panagrellus redivivus TaxID=6233 RepID=A0A7E4UNI3_PANRE